MSNATFLVVCAVATGLFMAAVAVFVGFYPAH